MSNEPPNLPKSRSFFDRLASAFHDEEAIASVEELRSLLTDAYSHHLIDKDTVSMMEGALEVADLRADDLMVPRSQVQCIDLTTSKRDWVQTVIQSGHSRFPVVRGDLDQVKGILHAKDLLRMLVRSDLDIHKVLRPVRYIPESQPINVLLRDFKSSRNHMALVVDEFGGISGLITIEDVLEQIVGEISDEFDRDEMAMIVQDSPNIWRVDAHVPIDRFNEHFHTQLYDEHCDTIGGLVTDRLEHVPDKGESWTDGEFLFTVLRADERQILMLKVEKKNPEVLL